MCDFVGLRCKCAYQYPEYFVKNDRIICLMRRKVCLCWEKREKMREGIELVV